MTAKAIVAGLNARLVRTKPVIRDLGVALLLALITLLVRLPGLSTEGFHNEDAAGITYNADLLLRGYVPLKDGFEIKGPGAFYLAYGFWEVFGRSIVVLQRAASVFAFGSALALYGAGIVLFGRRSALLAAVLFALLSPVTDSIDINYHVWMSLPWIAAFAAFTRGARDGKWRWFVATGFAFAVGALIKHQVASLAPLLLVLPLFWSRLKAPVAWTPPGPLVAYSGMAVGFVLPFAALGLYYWQRGGLSALLDTYFFAEAGWRYAAGASGLADKLLRLLDGVLGLGEYVAVPLVLGLASAVYALRQGWRLSLRAALVVGFVLCGYAGASIGLRYFKSYYLQVLPGLLLCGVHPDAPIFKVFARRFRPGDRATAFRRGFFSAVFFVLLGLATVNDVSHLSQARRERRHPRDPDAARMGRVIRDNTDLGDRIWVWGRWAWPVYFHADRLAGTRYYKVIEILTTTLTNTWRRPTTPVKFRPEGPAAEVIAELRLSRPKFIVVARNEDYAGFTALTALLRTDYAVVPEIVSTTLVLHRRRDVVWRKAPKGPPAKRPKAPAVSKPKAPAVSKPKAPAVSKPKVVPPPQKRP